MDNDKLQQIRVIYRDLKALLSQIPEARSANNGLTFEQDLWMHLHRNIEKLNGLTGEDYNEYQVLPAPLRYHQGLFVHLTTLRGKIASLLAALQTKYLPDEVNPLNGLQNATFIQQNQTANQSVQIYIVFEMAGLIERKLTEYEKDTDERRFLEKLKDKIRDIKSVSELLQATIATGKSLGLTIEQIMKILGWM